jgi:hypothetical protein
MYQKEKSPFDVDLRCNINIEINVAMRLGELIYASRTEDKQLRALGHRLSNAMKHLTDSLDDKQWDRLSDYMEDQSSESSSEEDYYSHRAQNAMKEISSNTQEGYEKFTAFE